MKNSHILTKSGAALLLAATCGQAQSTNNLYLGVTAGPAWQQDVAIQAGTVNGNGSSLKFDTGLRAGMKLGYNLTDSFAAEFETGVIWNTINQVGIQPLSTVGASADLYEIPLLVNGIYKFPLKGAFKPYIGVGVGAMVGIFDSSGIPGSGPGASPTYSDTDYTFAYQAKVGFKYTLGKNMDLGLAYQFVGTTDHSWSDNNIPLKTDGTMTHAIEATFTWRF